MFVFGRLAPCVVCALVVLSAGCSAAGRNQASPPERARRIVSLMPSLTEDLFAIGAGKQVVATSAYTKFPAEARTLPVVASFAAIDAERIVSLHPDVVVGIPAQKALLSGVQKLGIPAVFFRDDSYEDIFTDVQGLGVLTGRVQEAEALAKRLRAQTRRIRRAASGRPPVRCFVVLGTAPIYTVGRASFISRLIEFAGGVNAAAIAQPYAQFSAEALVALQPDAIVGDVQSGLGAALGKPPWSELRAVRAHHVFLLPDPAILELPGPRYNEGLAWLSARLATVRR